MIFPAEPNDYAAEVLFFLPLASDPSQPKLGHVFALGEVQVKPPGASDWEDVALVRIIEVGHGWYAIRLTASQRAIAGELAYRAVCADAQPDRGTEVIRDGDGEIAVGADGILPFFLGDPDDPVNGPPVEGLCDPDDFGFVDGEVEIRLPDGVFEAVDVSAIVEFGDGLYGVLLTADDDATVRRGKAIVVANVAGARAFSGYRTILGGAADVPVPPPGPGEPVPTFVEHDDVAVIDHVALALARLPQQYRGTDDVPMELLS